jgi:hypothetical protein
MDQNPSQNRRKDRRVISPSTLEILALGVGDSVSIDGRINLTAARRHAPERRWSVTKYSWGEPVTIVTRHADWVDERVIVGGASDCGKKEQENAHFNL